MILLGFIMITTPTLASSANTLFNCDCFLQVPIMIAKTAIMITAAFIMITRLYKSVPF